MKRRSRLFLLAGLVPKLKEIDEKVVGLIEDFNGVPREEGVDVALGEVVVERGERKIERSAPTTTTQNGSSGSLHLRNDLILPHAIEDVVQKALWVLAVGGGENDIEGKV